MDFLITTLLKCAQCTTKLAGKRTALAMSLGGGVGYRQVLSEPPGAKECLGSKESEKESTVAEVFARHILPRFSFQFCQCRKTRDPRPTF